MGGRGRARTQRKHFRQSRENVWKRPKPDPSSENPDGTKVTDNPTWTPFATQNPAFDEYYREQGIVPSEEWDAFIGLLRTPLPAAFRINSCSQFSADIRSQLENDFVQSLRAEDAQGDEAEAIRPLPWYPENLAWHSNFSRMQLRKNQTLERFHEFLKLENEIGNITRQEAVSMVPPLFLNVHPNHFVLDMCAAPGSKTFQLLEIIHQSTKAGALPNGMVIANDLDVQRCNLLIHQTKRMCTANLIVTNHEAQQFPGCRLIRNQETLEPDQHIGKLLFDCILCDVPCSGDGTLRKAPDLWRKWNTGMGNGLHSLQVLIAMRGVSLLKVGGRMVYSTCSMNPIENEAVVAEILRRCGGSVELADVSSELPQLIRRPGLKRWKVRDRGLWLASYKDVPMFRKSAVLPSMFPSGKSYQSLVDSNHKVDMVADIDNGVNGNSEGGVQTMENPMTHEFTEEVFDLPLERCMRIVPHDQNTGAFFIAVLQKVSPLPAITVKEKPKKEIDKQRVEPENQDIEDSKVLQVNSLETTHDEVLEEVNIIDNKPNTADLEVNPSVTCIERDSEEAQEPLKTESIAEEAQEPLNIESIADEAQESLSTESIAEESQEPLNTESIPEEAQEPLNTESVAKITPGKRKLQIQGKWRGVDPVVFFKDEIIINSIKAFYGIHERFPFSGHLVTRNSDTSHVKRIYYVSKSVKDVLELNFSVGQQLKITSIGLKMFERQTSREGSTAPCAFRISSEGLPLILPYITKQILRASLVDFKHLLQYKAIKFTDFVDAEFGKKAATLMPGYCVVVLGKEDKAASQSFQVDESTIAIGCWKGRAGLSVMVTAMDCRELLERLLIRLDTEKGSSMYEDKPSNDVGDKVPGTNGIADVEATGSEGS